MSDEEQGIPASPGAGDAEAVRDGEEGARPELDRLPPPAFPPGTRRAVVHRAPAPREGGEDDEFAGALISPDEPIRRKESDSLDDAFISPDAPFERKEPHDRSGEEQDEFEEGVVTGIGNYEPDFQRRSSSWRPRRAEAGQMAELLEQLAAGLRKHGSVVLVSESRISPFEAMLRGMLAGYLVGKGDGD